MKNTLTIKDIRQRFTNQDIKEIFESKGMYITTVNEKGDINNGMTFTINNEKSVFYFQSFALAYYYYLKMKWL